MSTGFAGVDDVNEFESELEAPDKWKRRFRMMKQDSAIDESGENDLGDDYDGDDVGNGYQTPPRL